ncbi:hypothetical protein AAFF_G00286950 [Aldrovandia affinis]|uniref:Uncharacterized protein n=1 Tax=Aldrovandia affinis TaxID=143900 RepID=A0AAD7TBU7_9TELE|nr:hypothetical protein AAFF_G00286950 [Aldrovandia affinis]
MEVVEQNGRNDAKQAGEREWIGSTYMICSELCETVHSATEMETQGFCWSQLTENHCSDSGVDNDLSSQVSVLETVTSH